MTSRADQGEVAARMAAVGQSAFLVLIFVASMLMRRCGRIGWTLLPLYHWMLILLACNNVRARSQRAHFVDDCIPQTLLVALLYAVQKGPNRRVTHLSSHRVAAHEPSLMLRCSSASL